MLHLACNMELPGLRLLFPLSKWFMMRPEVESSGSRLPVRAVTMV